MPVTSLGRMGFPTIRGASRGQRQIYPSALGLVCRGRFELERDAEEGAHELSRFQLELRLIQLCCRLPVLVTKT